MCTLLCTIRQSTNNRARRKAQNAKEPPTTERPHDGITTVGTPVISVSQDAAAAASRSGSGPYQPLSYIVARGHWKGGRCMTDPRGVHESVAAIAARARRHRRGGRPQPGERRRGPRRRRRPLPHGELLQDPGDGRGHAPGRRRRAAARRPAHAHRGGQEPGQHADPLPRGPAPERARPPLPDDHPERQHRHRHALAAGRPRRPSTRPCAASASRRSTASCPTASTSSSSPAPARSGPG